MRSVVLVVVLFGCCYGTKERYQDGGSDGDVNRLTEKLWLEIQKRLQDYDDKSDGLDSNEHDDRCSFNVQDGKIIRTQDSLNSGATFLNSPTVGSRSECQAECCDTNECNLAVFKAKEDNACYLFDCGTPNVCELTDHPGFEVLTLPSRKSENKEQAKHEDALENLAATPEPSTIPPTTTTTPAPTARHEPAQNGDQRNDPVDSGEDLGSKSSSSDNSDQKSDSNDSGKKIPGDSSSDRKSDNSDTSDQPGDDEAHNEGVNPQPVVEVAGHAGQTGELEDAEVELLGEDDEAPISNKGAVVALALGLAITALLLVFVGCRLRNVKRRIRRGRPLNSNEADYLVNGMYL